MGHFLMGQLSKLPSSCFSFLISKMKRLNGVYLIKCTFSSCLLSTCYMPGTTVSAEDLALYVKNWSKLSKSRNLKGVQTLREKEKYCVTL